MEKSYVTMEQNVCKVCGNVHATGNLLLDRRLQPSFDRETITGFGMCDKCKKLHDDGYLALVGIDPSKSVVHNDTVKPESAHRTGNVLHMKREAAKRCFNVPDAAFLLPLWFVEDAVIDALKVKAGFQ